MLAGSVDIPVALAVALPAPLPVALIVICDCDGELGNAVPLTIGIGSRLAGPVSVSAEVDEGSTIDWTQDACPEERAQPA